jgi:twitching motility protein PilT
VLRQEPDVILVGEIRDMETLDTALKAADTGHLVFSTLHTTDATQTLNRIISFYPPYQHQEVRMLIATRSGGGLAPAGAAGRRPGRVPACEVLINTAAVADNIRDIEKRSTSPTSSRRLDGVRHAVVRPVADEVVQGRRCSYESALFYSSQPERVRAPGLGHRLGVRPHLLRHHRRTAPASRRAARRLMPDADVADGAACLRRC